MHRLKTNINELNLVFVALIWGIGFVVTKDALQAIGPITFISWRFIIAFFVVGLFLFKRNSHLKNSLTAGMVIGSLLATGYILQTIGLQLTTNGKTAFITGLHVVLIPVFAFFILRTRPKLFAVLGTIIGTIGLGFLSLDDNLTMSRGDLWVLGCAVFFALHIIAISHFVKHHDALALAFQQIFAVALLATAASFVFETPTLNQVPKALWQVAFTGILGTALALYILTRAQKKVSPTKTGLILILESVFGAVFGCLFANEILDLKEWAGCILILFALIFAQLKPRSTG